jgi:hypothetical protein
MKLTEREMFLLEAIASTSGRPVDEEIDHLTRNGRDLSEAIKDCANYLMNKGNAG